MGFGVTELLIILAIVLVLFGAKKLRNVGGDLGGAIKNFKSAMKEEEDTPKDEQAKLNEKSGNTIEGTVESKNKENA